MALLVSARLAHMSAVIGCWLITAGHGWDNWNYSTLLHRSLLLQQVIPGMVSWQQRSGLPSEIHKILEA